jgi:glutaredoxin-related protein
VPHLCVPATSGPLFVFQKEKSPMCKYQRNLKKKISAMPDFEFLEITHSKHLKIYVRHKDSMTTFYVVEGLTPKSTDVRIMNIQANVRKAFNIHLAA